MDPITTLFVVFILAHLVRNTAGSLASRLAGSLAFAAAAILNALGKIARFECLDSFHVYLSLIHI